MRVPAGEPGVVRGAPRGGAEQALLAVGRQDVDPDGLTAPEGVRILAASSDHLQADKRRAFVASVAANDWDAVILTRTAFERLSLLPENERAFQDREMSEARERLDNIKATGNRASVKAQERQIQRAEERLKAIRDVPSDPGLHFEQTGIDYLVVDELHHMKNLATEVAPDGVCANTIQPGSHATDRIKSLAGDRARDLTREIPAGRLGEAADFGRVAAFLCSEPARFVTGVGLHVDGGAYRGLQ